MSDILIIGAGVIGSSIAHQCALRGHSVTVIDRGSAPGQGSTSASSAVIRFNYSTQDAVAVSWESYRCWQDWSAYLQAQPGEHLSQLRPVGMLFLDVPLASTERTMSMFDNSGIPYEQLDAVGIAEKIKGIDTGKYWPPRRIDDPEFWSEAPSQISALFTPDGGYMSDAALAAVNLADAAKRLGAVYRFRSRVTKVLVAEGRASGVILDSGEEIRADVVVNAAGPWSSQLNRLAGVGDDFTITLTPMRQEVHHVPAPESLVNQPVIADVDLGTYIRPEGGGNLLIGGTEPECDEMQWIEDPDNASLVPSQALFEAQVTRAAKRLPELRVPSHVSGVAGVYDVSSDWSPIYDKTSLPGFYLAAGTSGNQFKNAPVAGQMMALLIDEVESGRDHDRDPVIFHCPRTDLEVNLGSFSRKREKNPNSSGTVMG